MSEATEQVKHTPGIWVFDGSFVGTPAGDVVCQMFNRRDEDFENAEVNARLIAAAPDLLAACRAAISHLNLSTTSAKALKKQLRAAIARAEGHE